MLLPTDARKYEFLSFQAAALQILPLTFWHTNIHTHSHKIQENYLTANLTGWH